MPRLVPGLETTAWVDQDSMAYFTYKSYCDDCVLFLSAASYAIDSDIDVYINIGENKELPSEEAYDIKLNDWFTEHIQLDKHHEYFAKNNIDSMKQKLLIGISAKEYTTVSVQIDEMEGDIKKVQHGKPIYIEQKPGEHLFFEYDHKGEDQDIKFELTGLSGVVDLAVNCYTLYDAGTPIHDIKPVNGTNTKWSMNSFKDTELIISSEDENYCPNGVYLISTITKIEDAKYTLGIERGDSFIIKQVKFGVPFKDHIKEGHEKQYMLVLDKVKPFVVTTSLYLGNIKFSIGDTKDFKDPVTSSDNGPLQVDKYDLEDFEEGDNIYLRVKGVADLSEFILVATHDESYTIIPDSYPQDYLIDTDDEGLKLMFYPSAVENKLKIQINCHQDGVGFELFTKKVYLSDMSTSKLQFPRSSEHNLNQHKSKWDKHNRHLIENINMKSDTGEAYVILMSIVPDVYSSAMDLEEEKAKITVSVSSHPVKVLSPYIPIEETVGILYDTSKTTIFYKFFANGNKDTELILVPCVCMTDLRVYKTFADGQNNRKVIAKSGDMENGQKKVVLRNAHGPHFLRVDLNTEAQYEAFRLSVDYCAFQIILQDPDHPNRKYSLSQYRPQRQGKVDFNWPDRSNLELKWGKITKDYVTGSTTKDTFANIYVTKNTDIYLNSMCGITHGIKRLSPIKEYNKVENNTFLIPKKDLLEVSDKSVSILITAAINRDGGMIPYQPLTVMINNSWFSDIPWWIVFVVIAVIGILGYFVFFYRNKAEETQNKLDFELNDIRNVARFQYAAPPVEGQNLGGEV